MKNGWLDKKIYGTAARKAWLALLSYLDEKDNLRNVCEGTGAKNSFDWYQNRRRLTGDPTDRPPCCGAPMRLLRRETYKPDPRNGKPIPIMHKISENHPSRIRRGRTEPNGMQRESDLRIGRKAQTQARPDARSRRLRFGQLPRPERPQNGRRRVVDLLHPLGQLQLGRHAPSKKSTLTSYPDVCAWLGAFWYAEAAATTTCSTGWWPSSTSSSKWTTRASSRTRVW